MEFFTRIRTILFDIYTQLQTSSSYILKTAIFLSIVLGIPFGILFFTDYHTDNPRIESFFYSLTFFSFGLSFILLQIIKQSFWQTLLSYFMFVIIVLSPVQQLDFRVGNFEFYQNIPPYCKIISPDGQKIYYVQDVEPSMPLVDVGIQEKNWSFIEKTLVVGVYKGFDTDFCAAHWVNNDTIIVLDKNNLKEPIIYKTGFSFHSDRLIDIVIYYSPIILFIELLKNYRRIRTWLLLTVLKRQ